MNALLGTDLDLLTGVALDALEQGRRERGGPVPAGTPAQVSAAVDAALEHDVLPAHGVGDAEALRALASRLDLRPTKTLGQNFVIDPNTVRRLVRTAGVGVDDVVVEVGPGLGSLTLGLLEVATRVVAVEIDPVLAGELPATVAERLPERADVLGRRLRASLRDLQAQHASIGQVRGRGLMVGVELVEPGSSPDACGARPAAPGLAAAVRAECLRRGLIVELGGRHDAVLRLLPPLVMTDTEAGDVLDRLAGAVAAAEQEHRA